MSAVQHRNVTKEELDASKAKMLEESPDHVHLLETPAADAKLVEELLEVEKGTFPSFVCRFKKGEESCSMCDRHYSILDILNTGLQVHSKKFLVDAAIGKLGYIIAEGTGTVQNCYNCGTPGKGIVYQTQYYSAAW
jgi:hypothetical protein